MKYLKSLFVAILSIILLNSCATIFGGPITSYQKTKPAPGQAQREVRVGALIGDILFWPGLIVDFSNGAIYKPGPDNPPVQAAPQSMEDDIMNSSGGAVR